MQAAVAADPSGMMKEMVDQHPTLPTVGTVSVSLIDIVDGSTREKDGGQFVHVDGTRIQW